MAPRKAIDHCKHWTGRQPQELQYIVEAGESLASFTGNPEPDLCGSGHLSGSRSVAMPCS